MKTTPLSSERVVGKNPNICGENFLLRLINSV